MAKVESLDLETSRGATTAHVALPQGAQAETSVGVILIHEWWGINDHIRDLAGRYAKAGYVCVAAGSLPRPRGHGHGRSVGADAGAGNRRWH